MKLRTTLKIATATSVILFCLGFAIALYFRMSAIERAEDFDLYTLVPAQTSMVLDTDNMTDLMQRFDELDCSKDGQSLYFSRFFVYLKDHINVLLEDTPHGLSKQMNKMLISFHEPNNDRDQVFYCRLGAGDYEFVEKFIGENLSASFPSRLFEYKGEKIRIYPMPDDTFLACYMTNEFLAVSYQKKLIEQVIDSRLDKQSILANEHFAKIREAHRMVAPATIYAHMREVDMGRDSDTLRHRMHIGGWTEFNLTLSGNDIYLSGINFDTDSCPTFINTLRAMEPIEEFPGDRLPATTFFFTQTSISAYSDTVAANGGVVDEFLEAYAGGVVTTCMFLTEDTLTRLPHVVWSIPLSRPSNAEQALAGLCCSVPQSEKSISIYALPHSSLFAPLPAYACVYKSQLVVSPYPVDLQAYISVLESGEGAVLEGTPGYDDKMASLSQSYNFMMMADLDVLSDQPDSYVRSIPALFFRYDTFFRHFTLTAQFTCIDHVMYPNLVLTYKGGE